MHLIVMACSIIAAVIWGDWRNWNRYYPTLLYVFAVSLLYEYLTKEYTIWKFAPGLFVDQTYVVLVYAVITVPLTVFLFLSRYPTTFSKKVIHYGLWILVYIGTEWILDKTKVIVYEHNWSLLWSLIFDIIMFLMLRLHFKKPLIACLLSVFIIIGYMIIFNVPIQ